MCESLITSVFCVSVQISMVAQRLGEGHIISGIPLSASVGSHIPQMGKINTKLHTGVNVFESLLLWLQCPKDE